METIKCDKMIFAILQDDDYREVLEELTNNGVYSTILSSTGGFLKKKSVTVMMGVDSDKLDMVLDILKNYAGKRMSVEFVTGGVGLTVPKQTQKGGIVVFVMNVERCEKY